MPGRRFQEILRLLAVVGVSLLGMAAYALFMAVRGGDEMAPAAVSEAATVSEIVAISEVAVLPHCPPESTEASHYRRTLGNYEVPDLPLLATDGTTRAAAAVLEYEGPVMLNFIFTSCNSVCPVLSATFAQVRRLLGPEAERVRFVSVSVDPEQDTPARLRDYAQRYGAAAGWEFFTGRLEDIVVLQRAFDAYRGNKMSHQPLTFLRRGAGEPWVRLDGFPKAEDLAREYRNLIGAQGSSGIPG